MKKRIILFSLLFSAIGFFSFTTIPEKIQKWVLEYHKHYESLDIGITISEYPNKAITKTCQDSFLISPQAVLKVQCLALQNEQISYGYDWQGIGVAYGMLPGSGNYWEDISVGRGELLPEVKKYLMNRMIKNRASQTQLYNWSKPAILHAWNQKPDTAQALDMMAIYKCQQYLAQYNVRTETKREGFKKEVTVPYNGNETYTYEVGFTSLDWKNREDADAKLYAFWHRRIKAYTKTFEGFSLDDARHWTNVAFEDMHANAKPETLKIFEIWKAGWLKKQ